MTTLSAVYSTLDAMNTHHSALISSVIEQGKVGPYKHSFESPTRLRFGQHEDNYPGLGRRMAAFATDKTPPLEQIQHLCLQELSNVRAYFGDRLVYHAPSDKTKEQDTSIRLINSITSTAAEASGTVVNFPFQVLDDLLIEGGQESLKDVLNPGSTRCTILSADTLLRTSHSNEGTTTATLVFGEIIWVIWPPTGGNLSVLQSAYKAFSVDLGDAEVEIINNLEGGIAFVQHEGEGVRIPPFCPMMSLASKTSVLVSRTNLTVEQFMAMLHRLPFLQAWFATETNGESKQSAFKAALLKCFDTTLNGEADEDGVHSGNIWAEHIPALLKMWDDVKVNVANMLGLADVEVLKDIWTDYLLMKKGRLCGICGEEIKSKRRNMRKHFTKMYWIDEKQTDQLLGEDDEEIMDGVNIDEIGHMV